MIKYALQIIFRRKLRTFLTSLGVTISVILLSFIIFGMQGLDNMLTNEFTSRFRPNEMWITKQDFGFFMMQQDFEEVDEDVEEEPLIMNYDFFEELEQMEGVEEINGFLLIMNLSIAIEGFDRKMESTVISGWDTNSEDPFLVNFIDGEEELQNGCVYLSQYVANFFREDIEEFLGKKVTLTPALGSMFAIQTKDLMEKEYEYEVCGLFNAGADRNDLILTVSDAKEMLADLGGFDSGEEYIQEVGFEQIGMIVENEEVASKLKDEIEGKHNVTVFTSESLLEFLGDITSALTFALLLFAIVSAIVASVGIINTMIMSIYEQTREIGIIKAIGSSNTQVLTIFLIQSGFIGFLGGSLGLIVVYLGMHFSDPFLVEILKDNGFTVEKFFHFDITLTLIIIASSILVGILAGIYPSIKAARLDPVKALGFD